MKKVIKIFLWSTCIILFVCIVVMLICNQIVVNNAEGKVFSDIDSIKYNKVGLLLGTTPQARFDRITNYFFIYRVIQGQSPLYIDMQIIQFSILNGIKKE